MRIFHPFSRRCLAACGVTAALGLLAACGGATAGGSAGKATTGYGGTGSGNTSTAASASCTTSKSQPVTFFNQQDASTAVEDAIAGYIAVNAYCYPTYKDYLLGSNVGNEELTTGQIDVNMELWRYNFQTWYTTNTKNGKVVNLGETYESSAQYWYVPKYTQQANPSLTSVTSVAHHLSLFKDPQHPGKVLFINCMVQWHCSVQNQIMLKAYGVANDFYVETPGTEGAEEAAIKGAYDRKENFVFYWWTPTPFLAQVNAVPLQQPTYTSACSTLQADMYNAVSGGASLATELGKVTSAYGCGYQVYDIQKGANAAWAAQNPAFVAALKKMDIHNAPLQAAMADYSAQNDNAKAAALYFFGHYASEWESWLPATQVARMKTALAKDGVQLSA